MPPHVRSGWAFTALLLAALVGATPVRASDGVVEINQARALAGGVTPGDAAGFPVTLSVPGSYRLTGDLVLTSASQTAVEALAGPSTLDLGGFSIRGVVSCSGVPSSCPPPTQGNGVLGGDFVTVRNGTIMGMGNAGVLLRYSGRVEDLHVLFNAGSGVVVADQAIVRGNVITGNGVRGIEGTIEVTVDRNSVVANHAAGISITSGVVTGNTVTRNGGIGGNFGAHTVFADNLFTDNTPISFLGGSPGPGNHCSDGRCGPRNARRFYLTTATSPGSQATSACSAGYHMASLWELWDPSHLEYDELLGLTEADSGGGPPDSNASRGWIRTGNIAGSSNVGSANCSGWLTFLTGNGTVVQLLTNWTDLRIAPNGANGPWIAGLSPCSNPEHVWCVED